ncbi:damage-inducible protein DinB [Bacillus toyonensis]|uniref:damage-inducible protein DinB n=1 Tax=Bacillus toyonensis TaxID=155322 RepID=UPI000BF0C83A|nr:damage-inducible protein DinB [Bacillus toyonensis]MDF9451704.1 damage-inducible protein DinB [Bacillus toyonensis]MDG1565083.1 damage-inducible protein DinB [Bacillus toyonensis]PEO53624.1 damage-inducible protein DinB [Bacillus toyonensis]PFX73475.1 damage-inducible protein DinB [Bacillus toyonensis]PFX74027.1 damage-inducible protein DinB [Bacillus toyonensis]
MNYKILKDTKIIRGVISSIMLSVIAIALAVYNIGYWVVLVILSVIVLSFNVYKANELYNKGDG